MTRKGGRKGGKVKEGKDRIIRKNTKTKKGRIEEGRNMMVKGREWMLGNSGR